MSDERRWDPAAFRCAACAKKSKASEVLRLLALLLLYWYKSTNTDALRSCGLREQGRGVRGTRFYLLH